jgi:hypothetical protein
MPQLGACSILLLWAVSACSGGETPPPAGQGGSSGQDGGPIGGAGGSSSGAGGGTPDGPRDPPDVSVSDGPVNDATTRTDVTSVIDDASANCNDLINTGPVIVGQKVATSIPSPRGGTIADGTYYETAYTAYTGPGGAVGPDGVDHQLTAVIAGATARVVVLGAGIQRRYVFSMATSGTTTTWSVVCPTGLSPIRYGFDASASELELYITSDPADLRSFTLTRQ